MAKTGFLVTGINSIFHQRLQDPPQLHMGVFVPGISAPSLFLSFRVLFLEIAYFSSTDNASNVEVKFCNN